MNVEVIFREFQPTPEETCDATLCPDKGFWKVTVGAILVFQCHYHMTNVIMYETEKTNALILLVVEPTRTINH